MITENIQALVKYRLEQADEALEAAGVLLEKGLDRQAINRAYYAMFYGVLALLATRKLETSKHSGAVSLFDKEFIKPGTFSKDLSRWLHDAFDLRQRSDYTVEFHITGDEARVILENAVSFVGEVKTVLAKLADNPDISAP
jgi:uncharacterized protein (UPF0332 family)